MKKYNKMFLKVIKLLLKGAGTKDSLSPDFLPPSDVASFFFYKDFIHLFLERGKGREKRKETSMSGCLLCAPCWGPGPQPRLVY